jgi:hypothetical protein
MLISDYIALVGVIVNVIGIVVSSYLAWWIVYTIQKKIDNQRTYKDYLIEEVKELKKIYIDYLKTLENGIPPKKIPIWFKSTGYIKNHIVNEINEFVDEGELLTSKLNSYHIDLVYLITDHESYKMAYNEDAFSLKGDLLHKVIEFQGKDKSIFSNLIKAINNK